MGMGKIKDEVLVFKSIKGNSKAFELLLDRHLKSVYNFLFRLVGDLPTAQDLTQETFFKAWKNLRHFDRKKSFKTWLFTIARNNAYDHLRKKRPTPFAYFEDNEGNSWINNMADEEMLPDELLVRIEREKNISKLIKKLPKKYQIILLLRYKDDFSLAEIAEILGQPYNTIKSQHQRGLMKLRKIIENKFKS